MASTICPQRRGSRTNPPEERTREMLAAKNMDLFFQVYPNSLLKVLVAFFAFFLELS